MISERIRERRKAAHMTQQELGDACGFVKTTVCSWEKGRFKPDVDTVERIAEVLGTTAGYLLGYTNDPEGYEQAGEIDSLPVEWLDHFNGDVEAAVKAYRAMEEDRAREFSLPPDALPITAQRIPMLGTIHAGEPTFADSDFEAYVEAGAAIRCDFALRVVGDSMINARIMDGDIVFIRRQDTVAEGEIAAVLIDDEATLKRVRFLPGNLLMLQAENPKYQPIIIGGEGETRSVRILGKAVAFQSDVR